MRASILMTICFLLSTATSACSSTSSDSERDTELDAQTGDVAADTMSNGDCEVTSESSLPGVSLRFPNQPCEFSLEEVAAGITISYELVVEEEVMVTSEPLDSGGCGRSDYPLNVLPGIVGSGQNYCNCDVGLCSFTLESFELAAGTYDSNIEWTGRNWGGPSDTGNPLGEPFPAGIYTVAVRAQGQHTTDDGTSADYLVIASLRIQLVE